MCGDVYNNATQTFDPAIYTFHARNDGPKEEAVRDALNSVAAADAGPYRVGDTAPLTHNDGLRFAYPTGAHFSSTGNLPVAQFIDRAGFSDHGWTYISGFVSNLVTDSILGYRYLLRADGGDSLYPVARTERGNAYQENPYALPLVFVSPGSFDAIPEQNVQETQRALLDRIVPDSVTCLPLAPVEADAERALYVCPQDGPVYLYAPDSAATVQVLWNDRPVAIPRLTHPLICVARAGDRIAVTVVPAPEQDQEGEGSQEQRAEPPPEASAWRLMQIDQRAFGAIISPIQRKTRSVERPSDTELVAEVTCDPGDRLFVTLPYEKGWALLVDGQPAPLQKALNVFMGADMTPGTHEVRLTYTRPGGRLGLVVSGLSWIVILSFVWGRALARRRKRQKI
jgi:uncharacterized membrane protein YfhO